MIRIGKLVRKAVENYFKINKKFPMTILFYRDGVGDS